MFWNLWLKYLCSHYAGVCREIIRKFSGFFSVKIAAISVSKLLITNLYSTAGVLYKPLGICWHYTEQVYLQYSRESGMVFVFKIPKTSATKNEKNK